MVLKSFLVSQMQMFLKVVPIWHSHISTIVLIFVIPRCISIQLVQHTRWKAKNITGVSGDKQLLKLGIVLPQTQWLTKRREYLTTISNSLEDLDQDLKITLNEKYHFISKTNDLKDDDDSVNFDDLVAISPPPNKVLDLLCSQVEKGSSVIIYLTDTEKYGRSTASSQYLLQLAGYLGIPVIAWNADNSGLEKRTFQSSMSSIGVLQLAPSIDHQISAMFTILERYNWYFFGIVTSHIAGHQDFLQKVREKCAEEKNRFIIQEEFMVSEANNYDVSDIPKSEVRIILLYSTQVEAKTILANGAKVGLNSSAYLWIVTQSVVGNIGDKMLGFSDSFHIGMLGVHFTTSLNHILKDVMSLAVKIFAEGAVNFLNKTSDIGGKLDYKMSCNSNNTKYAWGDTLLKFLLNVTINNKRVFNPDGTARKSDLKIVNLRRNATSAGLTWEEVGTWTTETGLDIKDIVWPDNSHVPPQGVPEKFHMKITFLEEPPFIIITDPDPVTGRCTINRGVVCYIPQRNETGFVESSVVGEDGNSTEKKKKCCSGLCVDLLRKFEEDLGFSYDLVRAEDPKWGTLENGKWNGLMSSLVNKKTDMVLSALKISSERESVVDFTAPYLESGIAIVVAKRTGIISPTAFLEPFDTSSWMLVALVAIQAAALSIYVFEWFSPVGHNMKEKKLEQMGNKSLNQDEKLILDTPATVTKHQDHKFSLFRTYWLVWAVLFQASVQVDCPRGLTARFMSSIWALFAVVFLAIYTANLAAFMIPRKEYHDLSGLDDTKISNPYSQQPPLKYTTIPYSYSHVTLQKYHSEVFQHSKKYQLYNTSTEAIRAVKDGDLDAFIYDGTVLSYLVSQDDECRLLQVGSWSAMTGYGLAFPHNSKHAARFNDKLLDYKVNGDLERLSRYWLHGVCKPNMQEKRASEPLSIDQFLSAFLLLVLGTISSLFLLLLEHLYVRYIRQSVAASGAGTKTTSTAQYYSEKSGCFSFITKSLTGSRRCSDTPMIRSCSIPESLAAEWEQSTGSCTSSTCRLTSTTSVTTRPVYNSPIKPRNCRTDLCAAKYGRLRSELEDAQQVIKLLEDQLTEHGIALSYGCKEISEKETVL